MWTLHHCFKYYTVFFFSLHCKFYREIESLPLFEVLFQTGWFSSRYDSNNRRASGKRYYSLRRSKQTSWTNMPNFSTLALRNTIRIRLRETHYVTVAIMKWLLKNRTAIYVTFNFNGNDRNFPRRVTKSRRITEANNRSRIISILNRDL